VRRDENGRRLQPADDGGWRCRASHYLFDSPWYKLRQDELTLPGGEQITYTSVEHPGYAMVVPLLDDGRVLMERVYRHTLQGVALECPSGGLDGEAPEVAARRELEEETGYRAEHFAHLGVFHGSSGISDEHYHLFLATGLRPDGRLARELTEQMELVEVPLGELRGMVLSGELQDGPSALGVLLASEMLRAQA
jgi:ADP-ribose pyrophosphatase